MKQASQLIVCLNPECPKGPFTPSRPDKKHCCTKCRNRAYYLKNREEIINNYADFAFVKSANKKLKKLFGNNSEDTTYSEQTFRALGIPIDAAMKIAGNTNTGSRVHFFTTYGIESLDGKNFRIVKRIRNGT